MNRLAECAQVSPAKWIAPNNGLPILALIRYGIPRFIFRAEFVAEAFPTLANMNVRSTLSLRHSKFVQYTVACVTVIAAVLLTNAIRSIYPIVPTASLLFCASIVSGWFGGIGPGLLAALISSAALGFDFIPSPYPATTLLAEIPRLIIFALGVLFASWISGQQRQAEVLLERARDELEVKVQDRTTELRRANGELQAEIAERKAAEVALQAMQAELAHVSRVTMMGELTASIAHEVNQPLGAIMNYANACRRLLAADAGKPAEINEALSKIVEDAHRASDVIARIRALSQKNPVERTPTAAKELIDDVLAIAQHELQARGVTVRIDFGAQLPPLAVDRVQIKQVLLNLIINGMEAMETVEPADRVIEISAHSSGHELEPVLILQIRDHGPGVKPADENRLFESFFTTKLDGLGMGLAISRSIVEAHGGRLSLVPGQGVGATFQIFLPVRARSGL
jgi:signal transduction histidine kinase